MDPTAAKNTSGDRPELDAKFGARQLFLADSRLAFALFNSARYAALRSIFGMSREQANIVTVVGALLAADAAYETARRVVRSPLRVSGADVLLGGIALREAALGVTGAPSRDVRLFGTLVTGVMVAGLAIPGLRRAAHTMRAAEREIRQRRITAYQAAMRAVGAND
jgi:hypothetical protein